MAIIITFTALLLHTLPYDYTWPQSFLLGSMLSATDPVAVVALLKDVGASKKLATVIEGESLFNDGSAFVLFLMFLVSSRHYFGIPLVNFKSVVLLVVDYKQYYI